jgi:hypothetical protein
LSSGKKRESQCIYDYEKIEEQEKPDTIVDYNIQVTGTQVDEAIKYLEYHMQ